MPGPQSLGEADTPAHRYGSLTHLALSRVCASSLFPCCMHTLRRNVCCASESFSWCGCSQTLTAEFAVHQLSPWPVVTMQPTLPHQSSSFRGLGGDRYRIVPSLRGQQFTCSVLAMSAVRSRLTAALPVQLIEARPFPTCEKAIVVRCMSITGNRAMASLTRSLPVRGSPLHKSSPHYSLKAN